MSLTWPWALAALLVVPLLLVMRWWLNRRRRRVAVRLSSITLIQAALPGRTLWRRRIPIILFIAGLLVLGTGVARPQVSAAVPSSATSILLTMDVSQSMCSTDVEPNRLTVASDAARKFVRSQDDGTKIGLVAFSGIAGLLVKPTTDRDSLLAAIDGLKTARGTAIGLGILTALDAIAESNPDVPPTGVEMPAGGPASGDFEADTIVVLTDGANTQGVDPVTAAEQAAARKIRVYTIGFGTTNPAQMVCTPDQLGAGGEAFRGDGRGVGGGNWGGGNWGGGGGGGRRYQQLDEESLTEVADITGGEYYRAESSEKLVDVLTNLPSKIVLQKQDVEITVWFTLGGALLVFLAMGLSMWWTRAPTG
jgi:Ca-activated chloride channel family protein